MGPYTGLLGDRIRPPLPGGAHGQLGIPTGTNSCNPAMSVCNPAMGAMGTTFGGWPKGPWPPPAGGGEYTLERLRGE